MRKTFEKQTKIIEDQGEKQVDALKNLKSNTQEFTSKNIIQEDILSNEAKNGLNKIKEMENYRKLMVYKASEYTYSFENVLIIKLLAKKFKMVKLN